MARDLSVTFRDGRLMAAYLHLRKEAKPQVARTKREPDGMIVDFDPQGVPLGIEFIAPSKISLAKVNALLGSLGQDAASVDELWPLLNRSAQGAAAVS